MFAFTTATAVFWLALPIALGLWRTMRNAVRNRREGIPWQKYRNW